MSSSTMKPAQPSSSRAEASLPPLPPQPGNSTPPARASTPPQPYYSPPQQIFPPQHYQFPSMPYPAHHYFQPQHPMYPMQPAWPSSFHPPYYPWGQPPPPAVSQDNSPSPRQPPRQPNHSPRNRHSSPRPPRRPPFFDTDEDSRHHHSPQSNASSAHTPRRPTRRRSPAVTDRSSTPVKQPPRQDAERDASQATAELDRSARKAVDTPDEVTLALLLTSWANSLSEASQHAAATHFESVFNASNALHIVVTDVLRQQPAEGSAVWNALISLLARVLYGDAALHNSLARHIVSLNSTLPQDSTRDECLKERAHAIAVLLSFLRDISANMRAYVEVLPASTSDHDLLSLQPPPPSAAPAGPDPTKAVERSMDAWRRAVARLQGHMALIVVLDKALIAADHTFECPPNLTFTHLKPFYDAVREAIKTHINSDLQERKRTLGSQHWTSVTKGADTTVFEAARVRAQSWLAQFEASRLEVESQLDDAGIGFGPSARVSESKFSVLVSASARVAALVSCHQHSFTWAKETTRLLTSMITAFRCLEKVGDGLLAPPAELRSTFFAGLEGAISAIDNVVNWSFASLHDKVLGSLEKSSSVTPTAGDTLPPLKPKQLRFEEPPKVIIHEPDGGIAGSAPVQSRRKPRHARMKSSPDALLHLNAHFDDYSDEDAEADRVVDREIECNEDRDSEQASFVGSTSNVDSDRSQGGSDADANEDKVGVPQVEELPVVYENQEYGEDDEDDDDRDIIVHEDMEESKPKKVNHTSHIRSMSVDGIPF